MLVFADCSGEAEATEAGQGHKPQALKLKVAAIASVLFAGAMGVGIPILGKDIPCLNPGRSLFSIIKAFAAGVILATGFIHVLPDAFDNLTSPCLTEHPWGKFPFTGFVAMVAVIGTLMVDAFATSYYSRSHQPAESGSDVEQHQLQVLVHGHSHVHGSAVDTSTAGAAELLRNRVISQRHLQQALEEDPLLKQSHNPENQEIFPDPASISASIKVPVSQGWTGR
ncbi:hypothetical protein L3X38_030083 [Prunus dulcis]|uniref:Uncharacterized protein n=1 Tax=Prunus dulcis TaxID=3755 RepID=A0AAD4UP31_PRUDU|nr:hypothetical protein L3X38_030083 [Prunus dulcis]